MAKQPSEIFRPNQTAASQPSIIESHSALIKQKLQKVLYINQTLLAEDDDLKKLIS